MAENENGNGEETAEETAEVIEDAAEEIAEVIEDATDTADTDVDVTVIEAPEPEEPEAKFASVDVGDLHISGPAEMVEKVTTQYLKDHIDHNPHGEPHNTGEDGENFLDETAADIVPDPVAEQVQDSVSDETHDNPPEPADWLFRNRRGA